MNSNQRSQVNNQSSNGGNEKEQSSGRNSADKENMNQSQQSGQQSTDRAGSQTGGSQQQGMQGQRPASEPSANVAKGPGGNRMAGDEKMDDDTGLSNTANRQSAEADKGSEQSKQSNVGRRDDGTPD